MKLSSRIDAAKLQVAIFFITALAVVVAFIWLLAVNVYAQHEQGPEQNAPQNIVTHANVAIVANDPAVQYIGANPQRVTLACQTANGTVMVGDASTDATHGIPMTNWGVLKLDITSALYVWSATGSTSFGCQETVRP